MWSRDWMPLNTFINLAGTTSDMKPEREWELVEVGREYLAEALNENNWEKWGYDVFAIVPYQDGIVQVVFKRRPPRELRISDSLGQLYWDEVERVRALKKSEE